MKKFKKILILFDKDNLINIKFFGSVVIHNSIHNPPFHPQNMWTECRTYSTFILEMIAENHALAIGYLNAVSVTEERKSILFKFIEILMLRVN